MASKHNVDVRVSCNPTTLGYADNFLRAAYTARGTHVAFADQDDIWRKDKLELQSAALTATGAALSTHNVHLVSSEGTYLSPWQPLATKDRCFGPRQLDPFGVVLGFTMLFDKTLLDILPTDTRGVDPLFPTTPLAHDRWIYFLGTNFARTVSVKEPLAKYRQHENQSHGIQKPSLWQRAARKRLDGARLVSAAKLVAIYRTLELDRYSAHIKAGPFADELDATKARWERLTRILEDRFQAYTAPSLAHRAVAWADVLRAGGYAGTSRGVFHKIRSIDDAMFGVLGGGTGVPTSEEIPHY